jgi:hypothetical protein
MAQGGISDFFSPKFTHQVFSKDEIVRGYQGLEINIFLSPSTLRPFISYSYEKMACTGADDIKEVLS